MACYIQHDTEKLTLTWTSNHWSPLFRLRQEMHDIADFIVHVRVLVRDDSAALAASCRGHLSVMCRTWDVSPSCVLTICESSLAVLTVK